MRIALAMILMGLSCLTAGAEDWTVNGKTYHNVKVTKVEPDRVHFTADDGLGSFAIADLTPELQKRFNYDSAKAKLAVQKREEDQQATVRSYTSVDAERNQIQAQQQIENAQAAAAEASRAAQSHYSSHGGTAPVPVVSAPAVEDLQIQEMQNKAREIQKEDEAHGYAHASGRILQVIPGGFIGNISTRWGIYYPCFVRCDSKDMIDGQTWASIVIPQHTFQYTTALGALATVPAFTTNLKERPSAPVASNYIAPRAPVSSSMSVGGGN